jgi:hypothetical protein
MILLLGFSKSGFTYIGIEDPGSVFQKFESDFLSRRTRGLASGFSAAMCYVFLFIASKTYLDMEKSMQLHGVFFLFAAVNVLGFVFVYYRMPRMEGRSLVEIEEYFSGQNKKGFLRK